MENKRTNTDYQKFVRVGNKSEKLLKLQSESFFLLEIRIHYFLYKEFSSPTRKKIIPT